MKTPAAHLLDAFYRNIGARMPEMEAMTAALNETFGTEEALARGVAAFRDCESEAIEDVLVVVARAMGVLGE